MTDATTFADVEAAVVAVLKEHLPDSMTVSNKTPSPIPAGLVTVSHAGGGFRDWAEAAVNVGINVYMPTDEDVDGNPGCRSVARTVQDILAAASNGQISGIRVAAGGGTSVPRQSPPYQRYFTATVQLTGQSVIELD